MKEDLKSSLTAWLDMLCSFFGLSPINSFSLSCKYYFLLIKSTVGASPTVSAQKKYAFCKGIERYKEVPVTLLLAEHWINHREKLFGRIRESIIF